MIQPLMNVLDQICMTVVGAGKGLLDVYGNLFWGVAKMFGPIGMIANGFCEAFVNAGKGLIDVYGNVVYGLTDVGRSIGDLGKGLALGGAITVGGYVALGDPAKVPAGPLLGQSTPAAVSAPASEKPVEAPLASSLPGAAVRG